MCIENKVPCYLFEGLEQCGIDFSKSNTSLHDLLETRFGIVIDWATKLFSAKKADRRIADLFNIPVGDPITFAEQIVYDEQGRCIDYAYAYLKSESIRMSVLVRRRK